MRIPGETRDVQAAREAGRTEVSRPTAAVLTGSFLLLVFGVSSLELARDLRRDRSPWTDLAAAPGHAAPLASTGLLAANRRLLADMNAFEDALEEGSIVTAHALPPVQGFLTRRLEVGNEQVVVGRQGWLHFRAALDYLTGPGFLEPGRLARAASGGEAWQERREPDPPPAIADFAAQLSARGIGLVVVPTPVKAALHPEALAPSLGEAALPLENPSFAGFLERLAALEIPAYAAAPRLADPRRARGWPQFLRTDTHWTPQAMENAAEGLAQFLVRHVPLAERARIDYARREHWVEGRGDLVALLKLPSALPLFPKESVLTHPVFAPDGTPWAADPDADVLVLGDSFTNVFSQPELGWGEAAGFAEQLSYFLGRPVDKLAVNAGGPSAARERLAQQLASGVDRLAGKRVVVYQFSARELAAGDWRKVDLTPAVDEPVGVQHRAERGVPARGFAAWESNRSGDWRIWTRRLEGSAPRPLSPDEPDRQHCCTHVSPDGRRLVYLSRAVPRDRYPWPEEHGELRLLRLDDGSQRTLAADARPYGWGNRAAIWHDAQTLVYVGGDSRPYLLDVETAASRPLTREPGRNLAWLVDATLGHAVMGAPAFSRYDAEARRIDEAERLPGCEPYFTHDGRFGFWVRRGGGPIRWIDLASRATGVLLDAEDPRIPGAQRYAYFPMVSRDGRMFAFGASPGNHDHVYSNYDVFVAPLDPASLELTGRPLRLTAHPASDRYPDVHVESLDAELWARTAPAVPLEPRAAPVAAAAEPFEVRASLAACSRVPSLREISPYRSALIVCGWDVVEAIAGTPPSTALRVAHWAWRDGERQALASAGAGFTARLRVGPLAGAEIEGYPVFDTLPPAPGLPVYFSEQP